MFFLISIVLAGYLGFLEINSYGKLVPGNAITKQTKLSKVFLLLVQRIASLSVASIILDFFNSKNNFFASFFELIFLLITIYFFAKTIFLIIIIIFRIILDNHDDNPKPFQ